MLEVWAFRVREQREALGLTYADVATRMDTPDSGTHSDLYIANIESALGGSDDKAKIGMDYACKLAKALETSIKFLCTPPPVPRRYEAVLATREKYR